MIQSGKLAGKGYKRAGKRLFCKLAARGQKPALGEAVSLLGEVRSLLGEDL